MHYHLTEPIISRVTLMEVEEAIWLLMAAAPACFIADRSEQTTIISASLCFQISLPLIAGYQSEGEN